MPKSALLLAAAVLAAPASAQLFPFLSKAQPPVAAPVAGIDALRAEFAAQAGGTTIYFMNGSAQLGAQGRTLLAAQAIWLLRHPDVVVRIEGHGDPDDTRDHALAIGARRAEEVRDYLVLLGVPSAQVSAMTWGKERPGPPSAATILVR